MCVSVCVCVCRGRGGECACPGGERGLTFVDNADVRGMLSGTA